MATQQSPELQIAVVRALTVQGERKGAEWLLDDENWPVYTPQIRSVVISAVFSRPEYIRILLDAVEGGIVSPTELSSSDRAWLMSHKNERIRDESTFLFKDLESGNRMEIYERYRLQLGQGSAVAGKQVFARACSTCHSYAGFGGQVGPDLTGVKNQPVDALLLHTLVPNYEVYPTYLAMTIELYTGQTYMGWMQAESANAVTIRTASGTEESILRSNIFRIRNTGKSLMPDGLEQIISTREMNDLIAFLKSIDS
jgi:putative heme-binding domain-containing protein